MPRPRRSSMRPPQSTRKSAFGGRGYGPHSNRRSPRLSAAEQVAAKIIAAAEQPLVVVDEQSLEISTVDSPEQVATKAAPVESTPEPRKFTEFVLPERIQQNLATAGLVTTSPIQDQAIEPGLAGKDVVGLANTGTGKTAAFLLPVLTLLLDDPKQQALVLAPTRELAIQISDELIKLGKGLGLKAVVATGGTNIRPQITGLQRHPNIVIATPGRLTDLIQRRAWDPSHCGIIVLDEVDRMLDIGFVKDIERIIGQLPAKHQSLFFSATMPREVKAVVDRFTVDPVTISVKTRETAASVAQEVERTRGRDHKLEVLSDRLRRVDHERVIVFGRTKHGVERLTRQLQREGFHVDSIHGDRSQGQRTRALRAFKEGRIQALIATDVAARGLDIPRVSHVINYDLPGTYEDYVHRIGRTGRADQTGHALTFIDAGEHRE